MSMIIIGTSSEARRGVDTAAQAAAADVFVGILTAGWLRLYVQARQGVDTGKQQTIFQEFEAAKSAGVPMLLFVDEGLELGTILDGCNILEVFDDVPACGTGEDPKCENCMFSLQLMASLTVARLASSGKLKPLAEPTFRGEDGA